MLLNPKPFKSVMDLLNAFPTEQACIDHLEKIRWNGVVVSPFDKASKVYTCRGNRYKCASTRKYFNAKTGTIFASSKLSLRTWFLAIYYFTSHKKGVSSHQLAKDLDITQKSAWFLIHRLRHAARRRKYGNAKLTGVVAIDEALIGGKNGNRHKSKRVKGLQGRSHRDKTPVIGIMNEDEVRAYVMPNMKMKSIHREVYHNIEIGSILVSDEYVAYAGLYKHFHHTIIDHSRGEYVNSEGFTTNALEGFWGLLKRSLKGIYHLSSKRYLQRYLDEATFRYNFRRLCTDERFNLFLSYVHERRLKYTDLVKYG